MYIMISLQVFLKQTVYIYNTEHVLDYYIIKQGSNKANYYVI